MTTAKQNFTLRLSIEERAKLDRLAAFETENTGFNVAGSDVMRKLLAEAPEPTARKVKK